MTLAAKIFGSLFGLLVFAAIAYGIYYYVTGTSTFGTISDVVGKVSDAVGTVVSTGKDVGTYFQTPATCDPKTESYDAGLCYKKCADGWTSDGATLCYKNCPAKGDPGFPNGWEGASTLAYCEKKTIYSTVGTTNTIPTGCSGTKTNYAGLCYDVPTGWKVTAPGFIGQTCDSVWGTTGVAYRDDGTGCWLDADSINTGVGVVPTPHCPDGYSPRGVGTASWCDNSPQWPWNLKTTSSTLTCPAGMSIKSGLCYKNCPAGYTQTGTTCYRPPQVKYRSVKSQVGTLPDACVAGKTLVGRLCYPTCPTGYERTSDNLEFCSEICPSGFTNIGIGGCQKPRSSRGVGVPVHVCPSGSTLKGLFCYPN